MKVQQLTGPVVPTTCGDHLRAGSIKPPVRPVFGWSAMYLICLLDNLSPCLVKISVVFGDGPTFSFWRQ